MVGSCCSSKEEEDGHMRKSDIINLKPFISHCVLQHVNPPTQAEPFLKNPSVHKHKLASKSQMPLLASAQ